MTTCYDSYVTEFTSAEEEKCEDVFYKNCVIDFKQVPFDSEIQSCHVPMVKVCKVQSSIQGGSIFYPRIVLMMWMVRRSVKHILRQPVTQHMMRSGSLRQPVLATLGRSVLLILVK